MKASKNLVSVSKQETLNSFYENINNVSDSEKAMFDDIIDIKIDNYFNKFLFLKEKRMSNVPSALKKFEYLNLFSFFLTFLTFNGVLWLSGLINLNILMIAASFFIFVSFFFCLELNFKSKLCFLKSLNIKKTDKSIKSKYIQLFMLKMLLNNKYSNFFESGDFDLQKKKIFDEAMRTLNYGQNIEDLLNHYFLKSLYQKELLERKIQEENEKQSENYISDKLQEEIVSMKNKAEALDNENREISEAKNLILLNITKK